MLSKQKKMGSISIREMENDKSQITVCMWQLLSHKFRIKMVATVRFSFAFWMYFICMCESSQCNLLSLLELVIVELDDGKKELSILNRTIRKTQWWKSIHHTNAIRIAFTRFISSVFFHFIYFDTTLCLYKTNQFALVISPIFARNLFCFTPFHNRIESNQNPLSLSIEMPTIQDNFHKFTFETQWSVIKSVRGIFFCVLIFTGFGVLSICMQHTMGNYTIIRCIDEIRSFFSPLRPFTPLPNQIQIGFMTAETIFMRLRISLVFLLLSFIVINKITSRTNDVGGKNGNRCSLQQFSEID